MCFFLSSWGQYICPEPSWITKIEIPEQGKINPKDIKDGYYYLLADEQYNYTNHHAYFHYATKVVTEAGLDNASQLEVNFDPSYQKACFHYIKIHRNGTVIDKSDPSLFKTLYRESEKTQGILNGKKTYYRNLDDLRKGDILEYCYSIIGEKSIFANTIDLSFYFTYSVPVGRIFYRVILPPNLKVNIKPINNKIAFHNSVKTTNGEEITWSVTNPPITINEENRPSWHDLYALTQVSSLNSWNEVKKWSIRLFSNIKGNSGVLTSTTQDLIKEHGSDTIAQINSLVDFVQNQIRYSGNENGIYSHQPHSPELVLKNRFGDCKDKSLLLSLMLNELGVRSYPVLLSTDLKDKIVNYQPSIKRFDHCILSILFKGQRYFIDPTSTYQKGTFTRRHPGNYKTCMILDSSEVDFYKIPNDTITKTVFNEAFEIIEKSPDAILSCTTTYYGSNAEYFRYTFASSSHNELQESFRSYYLKYTEEIEVIDSLSFSDDTINNIFIIYEKYLLKKFWVADEGEKEITKTFLPYALNEKITYVNEATRKSPLALPFPVNSKHIISIKLGGGWNVENSIVQENNKFFDYSYETKVVDNTLYLIYSYTNKLDHVTVKDYKDYKEKTDFIDNNMVFNPVQSIVNTDSIGFNWPLLVSLIIALCIALFVGFKFYARKFSYSHLQTYDTIGGWLVIVAIGVCLSPITLIIQLAGILPDELKSNYFVYLFDSESTAYNPWRGVYVLISQSSNIFIVVASIFLIFIMFKRKNSFRPYFVAIKLFNASLLIIDLFVLYKISNESSLEDNNNINKETTSTIRTIISYAIWVPYVWYSERSKHTFTNGNIFDSIENSQPTTSQNEISSNSKTNDDSN